MTATGAEALSMLRQTEEVLVAAVDAGNIIGFTEKPMAALLASHVRSGRGLTADQARQAWRILSRNPAGLAAHGLVLPGARQPAPPEPEQQVAGTGRPVELAIRDDGRIGIKYSPMSLNESLKLGLYASFHKSTRANPTAMWSVPASPASAAGLLGLFDGMDIRVSQRVRDLADAHLARSAAYERLSPNHPLPDLDTRDLVLRGLWDHQMRGLDFATDATASLLGFPMGGGKTACAIATANRLEVKRGIIVCPNKVRGVWPREVAKWSARSWHIVDGKRPPKIKGYRYQDLSIPERVHETEQALFDCTCGAQAHFAVWNYEMLRYAPASTWRPPELLDMAIYDEVHRVKSPTGAMSKNIAAWVNFTKNRIGLSGTPMPQYPWDIFGVYRALDPGIFGTIWTSFNKEYVQEKETRDKTRKFPYRIKADKRDEFAEKVHSIMYRPVIDLKLPPVNDVDRVVQLEPVARKEYDSLDRGHWAELSAFAEEWSEGDETLSPKNVLSQKLRLMQFTGGTVPDDDLVITKGLRGSKYRVSTAKADALVEFRANKDGTHTIIGGLLDEIGCVPGHPGGPEPVVVFAQFTDDLKVIREIAHRAGLRYGEISGARGDGLTEASEMNPDIDICGVQIQAGGTGVDLTRARYGIWYSKGHSLGDYDQARARQHRPGQTRPVVNIHIICQDTVDEDVARSLIERRSLIAVSCERRGIDPRAFGVDPGEVIPAPVMDEGSGRTGGYVALPIDEFGHDVMRPRVAHREHDTEGNVVADKETLKLFDLEDF